MHYLFVEKQSGKFFLSDFIAAVVELRGEITEEIVAKAFHMIAGGQSEKFITRQQLFDTIKNSAPNAK